MLWFKWLSSSLCLGAFAHTGGKAGAARLDSTLLCETTFCNSLQVEKKGGGSLWLKKSPLSHSLLQPVGLPWLAGELLHHERVQKKKSRTDSAKFECTS